MGLEVELTLNRDLAFQIDMAVERALLKAADIVLASAVAGAPREPDPKHGVHLDETGYRRLEGGSLDQKIVVIGFDAFWAIWQHERLDYLHETGGHAKFLELAVIEYEEMLVEFLAAELRGVFG